jgi:hypothetical protein
MSDLDDEDMQAHVVMGNNSVRCLRCGRDQEFPKRTEISIMLAIMKTFGENHEDCEQSEQGDGRFKYTNAREWFESWDKGISALTIFNAFKGHGQSSMGPNVPHDPADFGRCYRLLKVAPEWRVNLQQVADKHLFWQPFVDHWDTMEKLYEEELPSGRAPKLYALMQKLDAESSAIRGRR